MIFFIVLAGKTARGARRLLATKGNGPIIIPLYSPLLFLLFEWQGTVLIKGGPTPKTLPKAQWTRGLSGSCTNLDLISSSESQPSSNFNISTKHQHVD